MIFPGTRRELERFLADHRAALERLCGCRFVMLDGRQPPDGCISFAICYKQDELKLSREAG